MNEEVNFDLTSYVRQWYCQAILSVVWTVQAKSSGKGCHREMVFASVELIPKYYGEQTGVDEHDFKKGKVRYYHVRSVMSPEEGLAWYQATCLNQVAEMPWAEGGERIYFNSGNGGDYGMLQFPTLPETLYAERLPFISNAWFHAQCNHFMPCSDPSPILTLMEDPDVRAWIAASLCFDLGGFLEYAGSTHLILPNPHFCHLHTCRVGDDDANGAENFQFDVDPSDQGLRLLYCERFNGEMSRVREKEIASPSEGVKPINADSAEGYVVLDRQGRILDKQEFACPITAIVGSIGCLEGLMSFPCKDKKTQVLGKVRYSNMRISAPNDPSAADRLIRRVAEFKRQRKKLEVCSRQKIFFNEGGKAEAFIRERINSATRSVLIIDPYFSAATAEMYLMAANVPVRVLCAPGGFENRVGNAKRLLDAVSYLRRSGSTIDVRVSRQEKLHDRFIVVDGTVWMLGSSLKTLGGSLSVIVKLDAAADPAEFLEAFYDEHGLSRLEDWIERHDRKSSFWQRLKRFFHNVSLEIKDLLHEDAV